MNSFIVELTRQVKGVPFGADRATTRKAFGSAFKEMKKSPTARNTMDAYEFGELFYTTDDKFEAAEFFVEEAELVVDGEKFPTDYVAATAWLKARDPNIVEDVEGLTSKKCGISIYAPDKKIETVLFADAQYF